jgi:hypothetical protein
VTPASPALPTSAPPFRSDDFSLTYSLRVPSILIIAVIIWLGNLNLFVISLVPSWRWQTPCSWQGNRCQRRWSNLFSISWRRSIFLPLHKSRQRLPIKRIQARLSSQKCRSRRCSAGRGRAIDLPLPLLLNRNAPLPSNRPLSFEPRLVIVISLSLVSVILEASRPSPLVYLINRSFSRSSTGSTTSDTGISFFEALSFPRAKACAVPFNSETLGVPALSTARSVALCLGIVGIS